jgi:hypothetical protein
MCRAPSSIEWYVQLKTQYTRLLLSGLYPIESNLQTLADAIYQLKLEAELSLCFDYNRSSDMIGQNRIW